MWKKSPWRAPETGKDGKVRREKSTEGKAKSLTAKPGGKVVRGRGRRKDIGEKKNAAKEKKEGPTHGTN